MKSEDITIRDVAARAGCSIASVSRVVTGNGPVSTAMRAKIVAAALDLGFPLSRRFAVTRPVISILIPSLTNPVFAAAVAGIEQRARREGLLTVLGQSGYDPAQEEEIVDALIDQRPVGMVVTVCDPAQGRLLDRVRKASLPLVTIYNDDTPDHIAAVTVDNRGATRALTQRLVDLGHRRIVFLAGRFLSSDRSMRRYDGYRMAMHAAGLEPLPVVEVDFIKATRDVDLTDILTRYEPTAIMASNDILAVSVIGALRRHGLSVPVDISVTGFDGIDVARQLSPRLTTVNQPSHSMGLLAASLLLDIAAGHKAPQHVQADTIFLLGETIAPPKRMQPPPATIPEE